MTLTLDQKIAVIDRAQDALRQRGWCQGRFRAINGAICANMALAIGEYGNEYDDGEWLDHVDRDLLEEIVSDLPRATEPYMHAEVRICHFNNDAASVEDVITQFQITKGRLGAHQLVNA